MKRRHPNHYLLVAFLAVAGGAAMAQPPGAANRSSSNLIISVGWKADMERDLGIIADVSGKLTELRAEYQAALEKKFQEAGINPNQLTPENLDAVVEIGLTVSGEFIPKAEALLSPEQINRLRQIEFQQRLKWNGPSTLLAREVAAELKLADDQKQILRVLDRECRTKQREERAEYADRAVRVLTDEQKETFNKLKGKDLGKN